VSEAASLPGWLLERLRAVDPFGALGEAVERALEEPSFQLDPDFLRGLLRLMEYWDRYFDAEVRGLERLPASGAMLLVGNHSGGVVTPDTSALMAAWYRERGFEQPLVGLAFDFVFAVPGFRTLMRKIGEVPANLENAGRALDAGAAVLVYPGGDYDVFRPWTARNRIDFAGRKGFVRLALRKSVPVVPVVGHGAHDSLFVLTRGERLARGLGLDRLRMHIFPLVWQLPWGLSVGGIPNVPLPAKVTLEVCPPLDWSGLGPEAAEDPELVQRCYDEVTRVMQERLDALAEERPFPVLSRLLSLLPGAPRAR
jgi:1-acyl-sn-glycerol-3-phosphate acyltransferase